MAINYAEKYSQKVDERFTLNSLSNPAVNQNYDWLGVSTVAVYSIPTSGMNDYSMAGLSRYGTPEELQDEKQEMTLSKDRSFTFTIDRKNYDDTMMTKEAGRALRRQLDEVVIPEIDTYRLASICASVKTGNIIAKAITKVNAYEAFLDAQEKLDDLKVPMVGRVCYCTSNFHKKIKLDDSFTKVGDLATTIAIKGQVGEIDGVPVIKVPASYLPANTAFLITLPIVNVGPVKLETYKIHMDPPGINGWLVEGRVRYDCFSLNQKKDGIVVCATKALASIAITTPPTKTAYTSAGNTFDPTGMVVTATYDDSTTATVTDYTWSPTTIAASGNVTITYVENGITKTVTQAVTFS